MEFKISEDMKMVRELLELTQEELAIELKVEPLTIKRIENHNTYTSNKTLETFYNFIYKKKIYINKIKEMFYKENMINEILLFHGSKNGIEGSIEVSKGRSNNDFGNGFYLGETYEKAASFVEKFHSSFIYYFAFNSNGLKHIKYEVNQEWMLTIAYFRGALEKYKEHPYIKKLISKLENIDYVIAPIADNRMYRIINSFIDGEITDEQCKHCLAATNLGNQYVLLTNNAINRLEKLECCFLSNEERNSYKILKNEDSKISEDKVKLARIKYRGKGHYIDEILK